MKKLLLLLLVCFPMLSFAQLKKINFNCDGLGLGDRQEYEGMINALLRSENLQFAIVENGIQDDGGTFKHVTLQQQYLGYPVEYGIIKLHFRDGMLYYINGDYVEHFDNQLTALAEVEAFSKAKLATQAKKFVWDDPEMLARLATDKSMGQIWPAPKGILMYYGQHSDPDATFRLVYRFDILSTDPYFRELIYVDASTGEIMGRNPIIKESSAATRYSGTRNICTSTIGSNHVLREGSYACTLGMGGVETYNMLHDTNYLAAVDFQDADDNWTSTEFHNANKDDAGLEAHWSAEQTMRYFNFVLGRNSYDNAGGTIVGYVNANLHGMNSLWTNDNAFWNGSNMTFGMGNSNPVVSLDITGHEIGHAVCQYTVGFMASDKDPGAINEGLSDIWGSMVENLGAPTKQKWLIGEDVFSGGLRNMQNPFATSNPKVYGGTNWFNTSGCTPTDLNDYCGVHNNATVLGYWFYLMVESPLPGIGFVGMSNAQAIVYWAETHYITPATTYWDLRSQTIQAARDLFGDCSFEVKRTISAWAAVGLGSPAPYIPSTDYISAPLSGTSNHIAGSITAVNQVLPGALVKYEALEQIELNPGFVAENGTTFLAHIIKCTDVYNRPSGEAANLLSHLDNAQSLSFVEETKNIEDRLVPNPATNKVTLYAQHLTNARIALYDVNGKEQTVETDIINDSRAEITWQQIPSGLYFIKAVSGDGSKVWKLVISGK